MKDKPELVTHQILNKYNLKKALKTYRYCKKHNQPLTYMEENEYGLSKAMEVARILSNEKNTRKTQK